MFTILYFSSEISQVCECLCDADTVFFFVTSWAMMLPTSLFVKHTDKIGKSFRQLNITIPAQFPSCQLEIFRSKGGKLIRDQVEYLRRLYNGGQLAFGVRTIEILYIMC